MTKSALRESAADIVALAASAGFSVTKRQLQRWHYEGLIPRPKQTWTEGAPGSEAAYPIGTGRQVVVLCLLRRKSRRSADLGWLLWWLGFSVEARCWKMPLGKVASWHDTTVPRIIRLAASWPFAGLRTRRVRDVLFRQLRKRLGPDRFDNFMGRLLEILQGQFEGWNAGASPDDQDLVRDKMTIDKALGLSRAQSDTAIAQNPRLYDDVEQALILLSGRLGGIQLSKLLNDSPDELIRVARNELRGFLLIGVSATLINEKTPKDQFGLKVLARFSTRASLKLHQLMLLYLLALKEDSDFQANSDRVLNEFRSAVLSKTPVEQIENLRLHDPALAEFFLPQRYAPACGQQTPAEV
jgi:hypothetical protein